jgi:hypothetical protein
MWVSHQVWSVAVGVVLGVAYGCVFGCSIGCDVLSVHTTGAQTPSTDGVTQDGQSESWFDSKYAQAYSIDSTYSFMTSLF